MNQVLTQHQQHTNPHNQYNIYLRLSNELFAKRSCDQTQRIYCSMSIVEHCKYSAICKHINIVHRCTVIYFTMQAHSVSLTCKQGEGMEMQEGRNGSIVCASPAKLHQIRVNTSLCGWVGEWQAMTDRFLQIPTDWTYGLTYSIANLTGY